MRQTQKIAMLGVFVAAVVAVALVKPTVGQLSSLSGGWLGALIMGLPTAAVLVATGPVMSIVIFGVPALSVVALGLLALKLVPDRPVSDRRHLDSASLRRPGGRT